MTTREHMPETDRANVLCYEEIMAAQSADFEWPELDEQAACSLCYTSGTTGNPKGVSTAIAPRCYTPTPP